MASLLAFSCTPNFIQYRQRGLNKLQKLAKKYNGSSTFRDDTVIVVNRKVTKAEKKEIKLAIASTEWLAALAPDWEKYKEWRDSLSGQRVSILDSVYFNKYKWRYIKKHHLITKHKIFGDKKLLDSLYKIDSAYVISKNYFGRSRK